MSSSLSESDSELEAGFFTFEFTILSLFTVLSHLFFYKFLKINIILSLI